MAVDEMLLNAAEDAEAACLRIYAWSEPTLSLGYFQAYSDRMAHRPSLGCVAVRRLTGGGAILHAAELTYSIVLPGTHPLAARRDELYQAVHGCLIEALGQLGVTARLFCEEAGSRSREQGEPALKPFAGGLVSCAPRSAGTVSRGSFPPLSALMYSWVGEQGAGCPACSPRAVPLFSAAISGRRADRRQQDLRQRRGRRNKAVLQHGSLLWRRSPAAPELAGVARHCRPPDRARELGRILAWRMQRRLGLPGGPTSWMKTRLAGGKPCPIALRVR